MTDHQGPGSRSESRGLQAVIPELDKRQVRSDSDGGPTALHTTRLVKYTHPAMNSTSQATINHSPDEQGQRVDIDRSAPSFIALIRDRTEWIHVRTVVAVDQTYPHFAGDRRPIAPLNARTSCGKSSSMLCCPMRTKSFTSVANFSRLWPLFPRRSTGLLTRRYGRD